MEVPCYPFIPTTAFTVAANTHEDVLRRTMLKLNGLDHYC